MVNAIALPAFSGLLELINNCCATGYIKLRWHSPQVITETEEVSSAPIIDPKLHLIDRSRHLVHRKNT